MLKSIKLILTLLLLSILITACNNEVTYESDLAFKDEFYTSYVNQDFDANNIVLTFGAMSDIHIGGEEQDIKLSNALNILNKRAKFGIDALLFAGDLTNTSGSTKKDSEIIQFRNIVKKNIQKETAVIYCLGVNHDHVDEDIETQRTIFDKILGKRFFTHVVSDNTSLQKGQRHYFVSGYNFISIDYDTDGYSDSKLTWLDETLAEITKESPNKPVFVTVHIPPTGKMHSVLNKYPQVICFSGHSHIPLNTDKSIRQDNYTLLHCGGMYYYRQSNINNKKVSEMGSIYEFSQGYLVEVDINNNVRAIRMDFNNRSHYSPEWIIKSPKEDNSHLKYRDLMSKALKPYFNENTQINFDSSLTHTLVGVFDSAESGNNPIEYYVANFWNRVDGTIEHEVKYISSQYALHEIDKMPENYEFIFFLDDGEYAVSVTAIDCYNASNSIFFNKGLFCTTINVEQGDATIHINNEETNYAAFLPGDRVNFKVSPPPGYKYEIVANNVSINNNSFIMPNENVEISIILVKQ